MVLFGFAEGGGLNRAQASPAPVLGYRSVSKRPAIELLGHLHGLQQQNLAFVGVGEDVERAVGSLLDIADADA